MKDEWKAYKVFFILIILSVDVWLKANKTFAAQGVDENCILTLKKRFRIVDAPISLGDSTALNAVYAQVSIVLHAILGPYTDCDEMKSFIYISTNPESVKMTSPVVCTHVQRTKRYNLQLCSAT